MFVKKIINNCLKQMDITSMKLEIEKKCEKK